MFVIPENGRLFLIGGTTIFFILLIIFCVGVCICIKNITKGEQSKLETEIVRVYPKAPSEMQKLKNNNQLKIVNMSEESSRVIENEHVTF